MDDWSIGWRKLVDWDDKNKIYTYKKIKIIPLTFQERLKMPVHLQNEYYWSEIHRIDKILSMRNNSDSYSNGQKELNEAMELFWESVGI